MKNRTRTMAIGTVAALAAGFSSVLLGAAPASATPFTCGAGGVSLGGGVCELTLTSGASTFTPPTGVSKLEALLVGGGGNSSYGYGGGGGQVTVVNFTDTTTAIAYVVGGSEADSTTTQGATTSTAAAGEDSQDSFPEGGDSGSGKTSTDFGGAGDSAGTSTADGGPGSVVSAVAPGGSLFATDANCYGGGGGVQTIADTNGTATCGGGSDPLVGTTLTLIPPVANSGGGAGSSESLDNFADGASGVVVFRWQITPPPVTLAFVMNGHGSQVPTQEIIVDTSGAQPTDPAAANTAFLGWYTDAALTTKYNFGDPIAANTTVYASWAVLATTGVSINPWVIPGGGGAVILGLALLMFSRRRDRRVS